MPILNDGEVLDDLQYGGMSIISHPDKYRFTSDSVRLANLVGGGAKTRLIDLCSGGGIIPILIAAKTRIGSLIGVELQGDLADMACRSALLNNLDDRVKFITRDLKDCHTDLGVGAYDIVTCNPPYYPVGQGETRLSDSIAMARHELSTDLDSIVMTAAKLLKFGGKLFMVHKCDRLGEVFSALDRHKLQPKELITYTPASGKNCDTFIVVAKSGARAGMTVKNIFSLDAEL